MKKKLNIVLFLLPNSTEGPPSPERVLPLLHQEGGQGGGGGDRKEQEEEEVHLKDQDHQPILRLQEAVSGQRSCCRYCRARRITTSREEGR